MKEKDLKPCPCEKCLVIAMCRCSIQNWRERHSLSELVNDFSFVITNTIYTKCDIVRRYLKCGSNHYNFEVWRLNKVIARMNLQCIIRK